MKYVALLRGINVGGNNKVSMAELKICFESLGYAEVTTYINSGNVVFEARALSEKKLAGAIEKNIKDHFGFPVNILVISKEFLVSVIKMAPVGFGTKPTTYQSDVVFLFEEEADEAAKQFEPNSVVDTVWAANGVVYYQRLSEKHSKSQMSKIIKKPIYKKMTIRNWNTVTKLGHMVSDE